MRLYPGRKGGGVEVVGGGGGTGLSECKNGDKQWDYKCMGGQSKKPQSYSAGRGARVLRPPPLSAFFDKDSTKRALSTYSLSLPPLLGLFIYAPG